MTLDEIEKNLPNGFHDSNLERIIIDYLKREVLLEIEVNTRDLANNTMDSRLGQLFLSDLLFCIIEPPDPTYPYQKAEGLWIADSGPVASLKRLTKLPAPLPEGAFAHYFFINDWNAFIYLAAMDAHFQWKGEGQRESE